MSGDESKTSKLHVYWASILQVDIAEVSDEFQSYAALPSERSGERLRLPLKEGEITLVQPDPRLEEFGWRIVASDQSMVMAGKKGLLNSHNIYKKGLLNSHNIYKKGLLNSHNI